ncbi:hypothetical protein [Pseudoxanthomonas suwonensis]|uniref:Transmembrane protein n=1 Tax=Pseudoxanthomonas suwonensis TaxID=314722 RepID=A0A0E3Z1G1_9GAMM|nr:hypothetical protein [Pseudoxanthomonas suwonensis]AKC86584.1 hypothetical protein WQ53_07200 [Pseudoxanthomonas suwonensis]
MNEANIKAISPQPPSRRKLRWIAVAAGICLLSWLALGAGILMGVGTGTVLVLASVAAVATEGTFWLTALVLGVSVYQLRRQLWERVRRRFS